MNFQQQSSGKLIIIASKTQVILSLNSLNAQIELKDNKVLAD
jgi:hypothetical protein